MLLRRIGARKCSLDGARGAVVMRRMHRRRAPTRLRQQSSDGFMSVATEPPAPRSRGFLVRSLYQLIVTALQTLVRYNMLQFEAAEGLGYADCGPDVELAKARA